MSRTLYKNPGLLHAPGKGPGKEVTAALNHSRWKCQQKMLAQEVTDQTLLTYPYSTEKLAKEYRDFLLHDPKRKWQNNGKYIKRDKREPNIRKKASRKASRLVKAARRTGKKVKL